MSTNREMDILDMPFEGLAAYWLSIKKLLDAKKSRSVVEQEIEHTPEPFIAYTLEIFFSALGPEAARRLAEARRDVRLSEYTKKIELMRLAAFAVAKGENPRVTLVRMLSWFAKPPIQEKQAFDMAGALVLEVKEPSAANAALLAVDHKDQFDRLLVRLLHYVVRSRRETREGMARFLDHVGSPYFSEGLSLALDGFEPDFLAHHLERVRDEIVAEARRKMDMSIEMCAGLTRNLTYEDVFRIGRAYLP